MIPGRPSTTPAVWAKDFWASLWPLNREEAPAAVDSDVGSVTYESLVPFVQSISFSLTKLAARGSDPAEALVGFATPGWTSIPRAPER